MLDGQEYQFQLWDLQKLHEDVEKQLLQFDEIIPYEKQRSAEIFSPRLLNMMLSCCPQIEAITKLITERCGFPLNETDEDGKTRPKSVPSLIKKIDENAVLSNLCLEVKIHDYEAGLTPFTPYLKWWKKYADLKHGLATKQFEINYVDVMDAFSALASLHCIARKIEQFSDNPLDVLNGKNWSDPIFVDYKRNEFGEYTQTRRYYWESLIFGSKKNFSRGM